MRCARTGTVLLALGLPACGGGGGDGSPPAPVPVQVTIAWEANRESAVNRAGGGYEVSISGHQPRDVPYESGPAAPTAITTELTMGTYTVTVRAYSALDAQGGNTRNFSAPSPVLTVNVP